MYRLSSTLSLGTKKPATTVDTAEYPPTVTSKKLSQMKPDHAWVSTHTSNASCLISKVALLNTPQAPSKILEHT